MSKPQQNQSLSDKIPVNFVSLGCPKNLVDSEVMMGLLDRDDFDVVAADAKSRVAVINTCAFVDESKQESVDTILEYAEKKKTGELDMIVVTGCLSQRYAAELPELMPEIDLFVGTGEYHKLPGLIRHKLAGDPGKTYVENPLYVPDHLTPRIQTTASHTKYLKISEGCSHRCSFCIIPQLRGDLRSRSVDSIVEEVRQGAALGVKEFNMVAQDLNEFGRDLEPRTSLYKLLESLAGVDGEFWLRLMYMYPLQFPDKLIKLIAEHPHIARYVDIPLQHISDRVLKIMNRGSSAKYIYRLIDGLKAQMPDITLRTTFIVGHPGETDDDFQQLKKFITETEFDRLGVFTFSQEDGTPSYHLKNQVEPEIAAARRDEIMAIQKEISRKKNQKLVGKTVKALFEGESTESELLGQARYQGQAPEIDGVILVRDGLDHALKGAFHNVKIVEAFEYDLLGEIIV